jgi:hypothetical protein
MEGWPAWVEGGCECFEQTENREDTEGRLTSGWELLRRHKVIGKRVAKMGLKSAMLSFQRFGAEFSTVRRTKYMLSGIRTI